MAAAPNAGFLAITPYREIFEAVSNWRKAPPPGLEEGEMLLTCMANSRLYEYYVLTALLDAFAANGFLQTRASRYDYQGAQGLTTGSDERPHANTFTFEKDGIELTLWYQPVVSGGMYAGENGLGLARASDWSLMQNSDSPNTLRTADKPFYTPDFILRAALKHDADSADHSRAVYFVADAKFSRMQTVIASQTMSLVFRYLFPSGRSALRISTPDFGFSAARTCTVTPLLLRLPPWALRSMGRPLWLSGSIPKWKRRRLSARCSKPRRHSQPTLKHFVHRD